MPRPQARIDSGTAHDGVVDLVQEMARWLFIESHWAGPPHWCQQAVEVPDGARQVSRSCADPQATTDPNASLPGLRKSSLPPEKEYCIESTMVTRKTPRRS
jgi:hypothetical protein